MSATLDELERMLGVLAGEQRKLLGHLIKQKDAMTRLDTRAMELAAAAAEQSRLRVSATEGRRRAVTAQAGRELKVASAEPSLTELAAAVTDAARRKRLLAARDELRTLLQEVTAASHVAGRLAGAVLGHLNTAMRVMQAAMRDAGTYTRSGAPRMGGRIGAVEMVG